MANTHYAVDIRQTAEDDIGVVVMRNPATRPVDGVAASTISNRLTIPKLMDQGFGSPPSTTIVSATAATPIVATVTTGEGANFPSGTLVTVTGGLGDLNINGTFFVTRSSDALTLVGSATNGTYTANSATLRKINPAKSFHIMLAATMAAILNDKAAGN